MAGVHNELRRGPFGRALKNAVGDSTSEGGLERFGETLDPIIDLWGPPEFYFLRGDLFWSIRLQRAADAGNACIVGVMLPTLSRYLLIVDEIRGRNSVATGGLTLSMLDRATIAALGGFTLGNPPFFRDQRADSVIGAQRAPVETFTALTAALPLNGVMEQETFPTVENRQFVSPPYIVRPGGALYVQGDAINQQIVVNFAGRVRQGLQTEHVTF